MHGNESFANGVAGILITSNAQPVVAENHVYNNELSGVTVADHALGEAKPLRRRRGTAEYRR